MTRRLYIHFETKSVPRIKSPLFNVYRMQFKNRLLKCIRINSFDKWFLVSGYLFISNLVNNQFLCQVCGIMVHDPNFK